MIGLSMSYIGIPYMFQRASFNGCDCWGLVRLFFSRELEISLPDFGISENTPNQIEEKVLCELNNFDEVPLDRARPYDLLLFNVAGQPIHIGMALDNRFMLHSLQGHNSCVENFRKNKWSIRTVGAYRWK